MNNKGTDQTVRMRRLVCACVDLIPLKTGFLRSRPLCFVVNDCVDFSVSPEEVWSAVPDVSGGRLWINATFQSTRENYQTGYY